MSSSNVWIVQSGVPSSVTGTLSETVLATVLIPAGLLGPNGALRVKFSAQATNNTNNKFITAALAGVGTWSMGTGSATVGTIEYGLEIKNAGVQNSQVWTRGNDSPWGGYASGAFPISNVDMTATQILTLNGTLAVTTDILTLMTYTVEVWNP